jgi:hypothetical protein
MNTINVIQGQAGVHKSRLAETLCAAFLSKPNNSNPLLGFAKYDAQTPFTVVYVDTERNLSEQFPYALQSIQIKAGYALSDHPSNFEFVSLLEISRKERFAALNEYLNHIKQSTNNPLFIVLDVSTDCIEDFNKTDKSMELIDLMNVAINQHNVIFLCLIHENPKSDKARGHFGTELMNKASTVMQVSFEKNVHHNDTNILKLKYLKCRSSAKPSPIYMKYCEAAKGLVLAQPNDVIELMNSRKIKATNNEMVTLLEEYLGKGQALTKAELLTLLCNELQASERTIRTRLNEIVSNDVPFINEIGQACKLIKVRNHRDVYYQLSSI